MARKSRQQKLVDKLHAGGIRKSAARVIAQATDRRRKPNKQARSLLNDLGGLVDQAQDRISGGPAKRKAAANKAAATRKRNALKRSTAAKKGAQTRAKGKAKAKA